MKNSTFPSQNPALLQAWMELLEAHRSAFRQERTYLRAMGLVMGELFSFARHTVTQGLMALGLTDADWSAWYRLFSRERFDEEHLAHCLFGETLEHVDVLQPYVVGVDGTQVPRSSMKMPGTSWLKAPRTPPFRVGIHRAQRFLQGAWLTPVEAGYSRAVPLRFLPIFPEKAIPAASVPPCREWEGGLAYLNWVRQELDAARRSTQRLLALGDGSFDTLGMWQGLPDRTALVVRTARNRCLYHLPQGRPAGPGRPPSYGERAPNPAAWLRQRQGWQKTRLIVRGRELPQRFRVEGPFVRDGLPECPVFLIAIGGRERWVGNKKPRRKRWDPAFLLVSAVWSGERWQLPLPIQELLIWIWQRWELEVAHREMKSGLGVGQMQCWNSRSAVVSVQWCVWVYALLLVAGYRTWGLCGGPRSPSCWWPGTKRWSLNTLWRAFRQAFWGKSEFQALWTRSGDNWLKKEAHLAGLYNAALAATKS
jgi:hypothetical protein